jgi:Rrf2 family transcriptional regulator, iron-sulfur cluster assembly transcription factor
MQIRREGDYAVRVVVELARHPTDTVVRTEDLSLATGVSRPYLAKVIQALGRAHLVQTRPGPAGGVQLARDAATITLRQIVEAVEGPIRLNRCLVAPGLCPRDSSCTAHPVWGRIQALLHRELDAVSARALASPVRVGPTRGNTSSSAKGAVKRRAQEGRHRS